MLPGIELLGCQNLAVPVEVMRHVVKIESGANPFAIGVVGGRLARQPKTLDEALATVRMLESKGYNYSLGLTQVNRVNFAKYDLGTHEKVFDPCTNLSVGSRILADCFNSAGRHWGKALSCYYSGNFTTGFAHGYVQKVLDSISNGTTVIDSTETLAAATAIPLQVQTKAASPRASTGGSPQKGEAPAATAGAYRIALRSVPLNNAASMAAAPPPGAVVPVTHPSAAVPVNDMPHADSRAPAVARVPNASPDIFVPQVRSSDEAPAPQANAASPPSSPRPGPDNAFVF
jgi:type IV secretion system protein VirB1